MKQRGEGNIQAGRDVNIYYIQDGNIIPPRPDMATIVVNILITGALPPMIVLILVGFHVIGGLTAKWLLLLIGVTYVSTVILAAILCDLSNRILVCILNSKVGRLLCR